MRATLRIMCLGELKLEYLAGRSSHTLQNPPTLKSQSLLAYLACHRQHAHPRECLMEMFWGDRPPNKARRSLSTALWHVRRCFPPEDNPIQSDNHKVQFTPRAEVWLDAEAFAAQAGRDTPDHWLAAVELYHSAFLDGFYDDWIINERYRLQELYLQALSRLMALYAEQGRPEDVLEAAQQLLRVDPLREDAHRAAMLALFRLGRRNAALEQFEACRRVVEQALGVAPTEATIALRQAILAGRIEPAEAAPPSGALPAAVPAPAVAVPGALPTLWTSFVGRERELAQLQHWLRPAPAAPHEVSRLVTLTGPGGCGKTRLALQAATLLASAFTEDAAWVELAPLADPGLVPQTVAASLGLGDQPGRSPIESLTAFLEQRQLLLVLDNCEHVLPACVALAQALLARCPQLRILATSHERFNLPQERSLPVPPLALPPDQPTPQDQLLRYEAVQLFVDRALAVLPTFSVSGPHLPAVAQICRRLDGLPLAIELAAARVKLLTVDQLAARLDDVFGLLTRGSLSPLPRHQTLWTTLDWSYQLLAPKEQALLRRLAVFAGGFSLEAAEAVCADPAGAPPALLARADVLDLLSDLMDKSLVVTLDAPRGAGPHPPREPRFGLLETIRQYAAERLRQAGEVEAVQRRHADFFLQLATIGQPLLRESEYLVWQRTFEQEHDNFRVVLRWAKERDDLELGLSLAGALVEFWERYGYLSEGREWLENALATATQQRMPAQKLARALYGIGTLALRQNKVDQAENYLKQGLAQSRTLGDQAGTANALLYQGHLALLTGRFQAAREYYEEATPLFQGLSHRWGEAAAIGNLGIVALFAGDLPQARSLLYQSQRLLTEIGERLYFGVNLVGIGFLLLLEGNLGQALRMMRDGLQSVSEGGDKTFLNYCMVLLARGLAAAGRFERAARLLGISAMLSHVFGTPLPPLIQTVAEEVKTLALAELGPAAFEAAHANGQAMSVEQAIAYSTEGEAPTS